MCTLTIIPITSESGPGLRIACNRDESRRRPIALPPQRRKFGGHAALLPIDPQGGGTWIGVNDAGLAMSLLNFNALGATAPADPLSRGLIIPGLLHLESTAAAAQAVAAMTLRRYPPFRLVLIDRRTIGQALHDGTRLRLTAWPFDGRPQFFTSSGLGDRIVDAPRRELFREWFAGTGTGTSTGTGTPADWIARQDAFHRHSWPGREQVSVCMRRPEARTVSLTVIEMGPARIEVTYVPDAPDSGATPVRSEL